MKQKTIKAIIYLTLSSTYSLTVLLLYYFFTEKNINVDLFMFICVIGSSGFKYTRHCPFKIFASWCFNRHLNFFKMCKKCYGKKWIVASIIYFSSLFTCLSGVIYLLCL